MTLPTHTPAKNNFTLPTESLSKAVEKEWQGQAKFIPSKMPLTTLAYTAIDRIAPQRDGVIEALLVYADTDTLCYRAPETELKSRQKEKWDVVLGWSSLLLGNKWQVAEGIMPIDQPQALHAALKAYLEKKGDFTLAAFSVLASGFSSLVLTMAVVEKHLSAKVAFDLARLEENYSAEKWGEDEEAASKAARLKAEMLDAEGFLKLLDA